MSDWKFLNKHRVTAKAAFHSGIPPQYASTSEDGFNGMFRFPVPGRMIRCLASDGSGEAGQEWKWQHVSVSVERDNRTPPWSIMCAVKDLFWEPEDWVCQFHPAQSQYVNHHPGCLHLWRPLIEKLPTPLAIMVGPKPKSSIHA